ncbi:hybrid sensor histidine kinase/response regulator [Kamptonema sp. UHCC 0994]|uniref:hybrid sensor histidine kinase/response regulator n=1 Tax=Kamptonema sp. UHCC 0994 TaxID=3031329 RepID=UPI0023B8BB9A|nr:hybrid sensor histidine kinase/response regulator [Kamptonema sp. UHCC 0994]MDF0553336.1 hybrid sensor histidine kinase/response regulator [Kamptonema sp. UHCC 0994]
MSQLSILIVDDEPDNFDVLETLLSEQDYQLHYAASGQDAIASLDTFNPDLILLDVMMPGIDGIEVCRRIKAMSKWQAVPIIMVTALNSKSDLAHCLSAGADDFISKPVNGIEMRARVHSMLRIKQQYDNIQSLSRIQENTIEFLESNLNELRGNLASSLSHELNTPLNGILGTIGLLGDDLEEMDVTEIREMLGWADQSARRLEKLTKKFLIYLELELSASRPEKIASVRSKFSATTIEAGLKSYAESINRSNDLIFALEEAEIAISERYLSAIIYELVDNALKFSLPETTIKISSQVVGEMLHLSVHDLGRGMTEEQIAKVGAFMQFERKSYEQQGIGMGLKIAKKIVELAGGEFSITSVYQQETTVTLTVPIVRN